MKPSRTSSPLPGADHANRRNSPANGISENTGKSPGSDSGFSEPLHDPINADPNPRDTGSILISFTALCVFFFFLIFPPRPGLSKGMPTGRINDEPAFQRVYLSQLKKTRKTPTGGYPAPFLQIRDACRHLADKHTLTIRDIHPDIHSLSDDKAGVTVNLHMSGHPVAFRAVMTEIRSIPDVHSIAQIRIQSGKKENQIRIRLQVADSIIPTGIPVP